jgi:phosphoglycerol transferase MdoB-like AlkP superfamily enzyme
MVVEIIEILVLVLAIALAFVLYKALKTATSLAINAVLGVLVLLAAYLCNRRHLRSACYNCTELSENSLRVTVNRQGNH